MGSHSVTCHSTQVKRAPHNPSHAGWYSIYLSRRDGRLNWPSWLDSALAGSRTSNLSITSLTPTMHHQDNVVMFMVSHVHGHFVIMLLHVCVLDTWGWLLNTKEASTWWNCTNWKLPDSKDNRQGQLCKSKTCTACYNKCWGNFFLC